MLERAVAVLLPLLLSCPLWVLHPRVLLPTLLCCSAALAILREHEARHSEATAKPWLPPLDLPATFSRFLAHSASLAQRSASLPCQHDFGYREELSEGFRLAVDAELNARRTGFFASSGAAYGSSNELHERVVKELESRWQREGRGDMIFIKVRYYAGPGRRLLLFVASSS